MFRSHTTDDQLKVNSLLDQISDMFISIEHKTTIKEFKSAFNSTKKLTRESNFCKKLINLLNMMYMPKKYQISNYRANRYALNVSPIGLNKSAYQYNTFDPNANQAQELYSDSTLYNNRVHNPHYGFPPTSTKPAYYALSNKQSHQPNNLYALPSNNNRIHPYGIIVSPQDPRHGPSSASSGGSRKKTKKKRH